MKTRISKKKNAIALKIYKDIEEDFCKNHPKKGVNRFCNTGDDLIVHAMEIYNKKSLKVAESLWRLLDDIDTASDMFKPSETNGIKSYKNFYEYAMKKQAERWKYLTNDEKDQNKLVINPKLCVGKNV